MTTPGIARLERQLEEAQRGTVTDVLGTRYLLCVSTAPATYDGIRVLSIYDGGDGRRYILVPESELEWQRGRNTSGLYTLERTYAIPEAMVRQQLFARLRRS